MSIHVQLSPEALENLRRQQRNSTISSIIASILVVAAIFLILGIFLLPSVVKESPTIVTYESSVTQEEQVTEKKVNTQIQKKPSAPSSAMNKVIAANSSSSPVSIPVPDVDVSTPSLEFGDGQDFGGGWGDAGDFGSGGGFGAIPQDMRKRCSPQDRMNRLKESGGTAECEDAVVKALDFLQKTQNPDGSWEKTNQAAMTGFALLAYLGHCETPKSDKYGDTVLKAITYLVNLGMKNKGSLSLSPNTAVPHVYEHGIATYAMCEAYTFCSKLDIQIPDLDKVVKKAVDIILDGQLENGGWIYGYKNGGQTGTGDNSVGFWQIQALKASKHTGIVSESKLNSAAKKALKWLGSVQSPEGAIGYRNDPKRSPYLTGGAVLCFQIWGEGNSKEARKGIDYIDKHTQFKWGDPSSNLYYHYYNIQAMLNHGGREWEKYNKLVRDALVKAQNPTGSWTQRVGSHGPVNDHMATCLATLALEAYYRFLPGSAK